MSDITKNELLEVAATIDRRHGWDFSRVRDSRGPVPWDYDTVVRQYLQPDHLVLDVGTGGAERFLLLRDAYRHGIGLDPTPEMIADARENVDCLGTEAVELAQGTAERLPFDDACFDIVLNRHANVHVTETMRGLRPGGFFITQQVGLRNLENICSLFGCGLGGEYGYDPNLTVYTLAADFRAHGAQIWCVAEYDVPYTFLDMASLLFLLEAVGIPEDYDLTRHWPQVLKIIERHSTPQGIRSNEHRELLIVQKPE